MAVRNATQQVPRQQSRTGTASRRWPASLAAVPLLAPAMLLLLGAFVAPIVILFLYSFSPERRRLLLDQPSLTWYSKVFTDSFYYGILLDTLKLAFTVTLITLLLAYPVAYGLARSRSRWRGPLTALVIAPLLTNIVVRTMGWLVVLGDHGLVNETLLGWGLIREPLVMLGTDLGVTIALVHIFLPFMILPLVGAIENVDRTVEEAARSLGAGPVAAFFRITLPLSLPGILAGSTLVFLLAMASFITPLILGLGKYWVISTVIYQQIRVTNWALAGALSFVLLAATFLTVLLSLLLGSRFGATQRVPQVSAGATARPRAPGVLRRGLVILDRGWDASWQGVYRAQGRLYAVTPALPLTLRGPWWRWFGRALIRLIRLAVYAFLLFPLVMVVRTAVDTQTVLSANFQDFTLDWFGKALANPQYRDALWLSLQLAVAAMCLSLVIGTLAALAIARVRFPGRHAMTTFLMSPIMIPGMVTAVAILIYFQQLAVAPSFERLLVAHLIVTLPYVMRLVLPALQAVDPAVIESASTLGANRLRVFWHVTLPLIKPGLIAAAIFAFLMSFDEVTLTLLVRGTKLTTLPIQIYNQLNQVWDPTVSAISTLLILVTAVAIVVLDRSVGLSKLKVG